ncbi:MAG: exodeoxyribonuclease VII small subunit [Clostridia bacterium]|nr:exodeoxyribonuclease VII small subunit [Clostridia bacterium]
MSEFNYEKSVKRLEEIVKALESGEFTLDKMIKLYEEGVAISTECNKALDEAEFKITELASKGNSNND